MSDEQTDTTEETPLIRDLRNQIKTLQKKNRDLETTVRGSVFTDVFSEYGLDPAKGAGKLAAETYDGDLDPNAVSEWLTDQGFEPVEQSNDEQTPPPGETQRQEQQQRLQQVRESSQPSSGQTITADQAASMAASGGMADVLKAQAEGRIERSPAVQALIERNRAENARVPRLG